MAVAVADTIAPGDRESEGSGGDGRRIVVLGAAAAVASVVLWAVWTARHQGAMWTDLDLEVYRDGGVALRSGDALYVRNYTGVKLPFTYPPFAAMVFAVVSFIKFAHLKLLVGAGNAAGVFVAAFLAWRIAKPAGSRATAIGWCLLIGAVGLWTEPVQQTLAFGQVNIVLMVIVLADLAFSDRRWWKGIGIGLAAGFKLTPAFFILYLAATRRFRAAAVASGAFAATIVGAYAFVPNEAGDYWGGRLFMNSSRVGGINYVGNQSLHGFVYRLLDGAPESEHVYKAVAALVAILGLFLAARCHRRGDVLLGALTAATTALLVSPISWSHHWVWVVPWTVWAVVQVRRRPTPGAVVLTLAGIGAFLAWFTRAGGPHSALTPSGIIWSLPYRDNAEYSWTGPEHLIGDAYVLMGLTVLGWQLVDALLSRRSAKSGVGVPDSAVGEVAA